MKKFITMLLVAALSMSLASSVRAIEDPDPVGAITVGAHASVFPGFGGNLFADYVLIDSWWKGHFTVGGTLGFNTLSSTNTAGAMGYVLNTTVRSNRFCFVPRATYGLNILYNLEVHVGAQAGIAYVTSKATVTDGNGVVLPTDTEDGDGVRLVVGGLAGARYFFTDNFGASLELNYGTYMPYINAGVAFRF